MSFRIFIVDQTGCAIEFIKDGGRYLMECELTDTFYPPVPIEYWPVDLTDFLETTAGLIGLNKLMGMPYHIPTWYKCGKNYLP